AVRRWLPWPAAAACEAAAARSHRVSGVARPRCPRALLDGEVARPERGVPAGAIRLPPAAQVDLGRTDAQAVEGDVGEPTGEVGVDAEATMRGVGLEAQDRLEQVEDRAGGPGLGDVGAGVEDRERVRLAGDAGKELGEPVTHEEAGGLRDVPRDAG